MSIDTHTFLIKEMYPEHRERSDRDDGCDDCDDVDFCQIDPADCDCLKSDPDTLFESRRDGYD